MLYFQRTKLIILLPAFMLKIFDLKIIYYQYGNFFNRNILLKRHSYC